MSVRLGYREPLPDMSGWTLETAVHHLAAKCCGAPDCVGIGTKGVINYVHDYLCRALEQTLPDPSPLSPPGTESIT